MIDHNIPLAESFPEMEDLPGAPDPGILGGPITKYLDKIGDRSWKALGRLTPDELLELPHVGRSRLEKLTAALVNLVGSAPSAPQRQEGLDPRISDALVTIASWASGTGRAGSLLDALFAATADDQADAPRRAIELLRSVPVSALADQEMVAQHDPVVIAERIIESCDEREREILERILDVDHDYPTLEEVGLRFGVTRERIRQIETNVKTRIEAATERSDHLSLVAAAQALSDRLGAAIPLDEIQTEFATFPPDLVDRLILHLAGPYKVRDGWVLDQAVDPIDETVLATFDQVADDGWIEIDAFEDALGELGIHAPHLRKAIASTPRLCLFEEFDAVIDWRGSLGQKAARILAARGLPMTADDLNALVKPNSDRSFLNQLHDIDSIVRVGKQRFALADWGLAEFEGIVPAMSARLAEAGAPLDIDALGSELEAEYGISATSVSILAGTHPAFLSEGGQVRLRGTDEPYIPDDRLTDTARCYRIDGNWAWRVPVDNDVLRGSGRWMPEAFAVHLGLEPLGRGRVRTPQGDVGLRWGQSPSIGSLRSMANRTEADEGDWVFLVSTAASTLDFRLLRATDLADDAETRLRQLVGAPEDGSIDTVLADALDLSGAHHHERAEIRDHLLQRREHDLIELLDQC